MGPSAALKGNGKEMIHCKRYKQRLNKDGAECDRKLH